MRERRPGGRGLGGGGSSSRTKDPPAQAAPQDRREPKTRFAVHHGEGGGVESGSGDPESPAAAKNDKTSSRKSSRPSSKIRVQSALAAAITGLLVLLVVIAAVISMIRSNNDDRPNPLGGRRSRGYYLTALLASLPVLLSASVALGRGREGNERVVAGAFALSILGNQLPKVAAKFMGAALAAAFGLATRPKKEEDEDAGGSAVAEKKKDGNDGGAHRHKGWFGLSLRPLAFLSTFLLVAVLLTENFLVWVVSATYEPGMNPPYPEPLQDNGRIVVTNLMDRVGLTNRDAQDLRNAFNVQWALVSSAVAGALLGCELGLGRARSRSMWGVGMRGVLALAIARGVRGISFVLTVLPSQVRGCYRGKYPYPPPSDWAGWIAVGIKPASRGGCNDLIVSGHATVTSVLACVASSVGDNSWLSFAIWTLLALDYLVEVLQGFHYSVDMFLGAVITSLIFRSLRDVEDIDDPEQAAKAEFAPLSEITGRDLVAYVAPALLGFAVLTMAEEATANVWIVLLVAAAVVTQLKGMAHVSRNILICTLYVTLGVYL